MSTNELEMKIAKMQEQELLAEEAKKEADALRNEIKEEMHRTNRSELIAGRFVVRFIDVLSTRFDTKRFKEKFGEDVYNAFTKQVPSKRFTVTEQKKSPWISRQTESIGPRLLNVL